MSENDKPVLVYTTCPSLETAETIAGKLVEEGLSACVNIIPGMVSVYVWQGQRQRDEEVVVLVKTVGCLADAVLERINELHPYDVPAGLIIPLAGGSPEFVGWIAAQTAMRQP